MKSRLTKKAREHLGKARESCLAAVAAYNNPTAEFRSGTYVVLIIIAWTSLLHAVFYQQRVKPWHILSGTGKGIRYKKFGSDYWYWNLRECLHKYYGSNSNALEANLRFLIGLRDGIEHRNMPELDHEVFGECQAALLNFERLLVKEFGERQALNISLAFSLQFSGIVPEQRRTALEALRRSGIDSVVNYIRQFRNELALEIVNDQQFAFKVFLVPQLANHRSIDTLAIEWLPLDESNPAALEAVDQAIVLMKQRHVPVRNPGNLLAGRVVDTVDERIPWRFRQYEHTQCWKHFSVRPPAQTSDPGNCHSQYCQWDTAFRRYVYTELWVEKLVEELTDPEHFQQIVGKAPVGSSAGDGGIYA